MSYLPVDQETNANGPAGATTNQPGQAGGQPPPAQSGGSAGTGQGAGAPSGASNGSPTQFGSSASKLGDYLTANAPQIGAQAQGVTNNLNTAYGQVGNDINNTAQGFGQTVAAGYTPENRSVSQQAAANPTGFAATPGNVGAYQAQANDKYTGPTSYEGSTPYSNIQNEVNTATQNAGLLKTPTGLQNYLSTQGGGAGNATQASNTLDTLLYNGNPAANAQIQGAAGQFQQLTPQLAQSAQAQDAAIATGQQQAADASQYAQGQLNPVAQQFQTGLNTNLGSVNANEAAYNNEINANQQTAQTQQAAINNALAQNLQTSQTATGGGVSAPYSSGLNQFLAAQFNPSASMANSSLTPYLNGQLMTAPGTLANTASTAQYGEDAALAQLLGQGYTPSLNQTDVGQAGSYNVPTLPGSVPNTGNEVSYLNDLGQLYGNTNDRSFINSAGGGATPTYQTAQPLATEMLGNAASQGSGLQLSPTQLAALQRLAGGEQGYQPTAAPPAIAGQGPATGPLRGR